MYSPSPFLYYRWTLYLSQYGVSKEWAREVFDDVIVKRYSEPHRHYHTLEHIDSCISLLDQRIPYVDGLNVIFPALIFHDIVYDPLNHPSNIKTLGGRRSNEEESADLFMQVHEEIGIPEHLAGTISAVIKLTDYATKIDTFFEEEMIRAGLSGIWDYVQHVRDIDLSVLGATEDQFDKYDANVRKEYGFVPDEVYNPARVKVLGKILGQKHIYSTPAFKYLQEPAEDNLKRAIRRLSV